MFSVDSRYDAYQNIVNHSETKAEVRRAIKGFSVWLFNHRHIPEVVDRTAWFNRRMAMDKAAWKIK
jgi:hypothetical protein